MDKSNTNKYQDRIGLLGGSGENDGCFEDVIELELDDTLKNSRKRGEYRLDSIDTSRVLGLANCRNTKEVKIR